MIVIVGSLGATLVATLPSDMGHAIASLKRIFMPGKYDFHYYDKVVETARRHGISVYGLLAYWSRWTKPYTEEGIDDFCRWARAVVRRYKGKVKHWEIYNEPNIFFWSGP
ncbi:MAG: family 1 glycosylhydrolase, partial [Nannocystaceae bacterium]